MEYWSFLYSPIGLLKLIASDQGFQSIELLEHADEFEPNPNSHLIKAKIQLTEYFQKQRRYFDLNFDLVGYTDFQKSVWRLVSKIPYGQTVSYLDIAKNLNNPGAVRAVGMANGQNPIPIIIPCHRVIASDRSLRGYAWGLEIKNKLLMLENPKTFGVQKNLF